MNDRKVTAPHTEFDELHEALMTLLDRIDVQAANLAVDVEGYAHTGIEEGIHELTRQRFTIMEAHGYTVVGIEPTSGATH